MFIYYFSVVFLVQSVGIKLLQSCYHVLRWGVDELVLDNKNCNTYCMLNVCNVRIRCCASVRQQTPLYTDSKTYIAKMCSISEQPVNIVEISLDHMQADLVLDLVHRLLIVKLHSDSLFSK